jgi:cation transport ATPase
MHHDDSTGQERWLTRYYFTRAAFSFAWVAAALTAGRQSWFAAAALLVAYPVWDALANYIDVARSGGLGRNRTQALNVVVSLATAMAVAFSLASMHLVLGVFGAWAILSGLLQLGTALRRWKTHGAQWAMVLSGAQSALAGGFFIAQARMPAVPSIANVAGYAGVGAAYFLVSAVWLAVAAARRRTEPTRP